MAKYTPTDIPPGETKRICDMTLDEYKSWRGRCGGSSRSKKKLKALLRSARAKKPGLKMFHATVRKVAEERLFTIEGIKSLSTEKYPIGGLLAATILARAMAHAERNAVK